MKLGISTASFYPKLTEYSLEAVGKSGCKNAEIFFNASVETKQDFVKELKEIKDFYGMNITSIHPTMSLAESFMLFSNYRRRYDEAIEWYKRYGEIAAYLEAKYVILHGGKPNKAINNDEYFERFASLSETVENHGGVLLQENVAKYRANSLETVSDMISAIGERAKFCLDIKQCIRGGYTPFDALDVMKEHIKHIHISDHNGEKDCLLPLKGNFDYPAFFGKLSDFGFNGYGMIEVYKDAYNSESEIFESLNKLEHSVIK